MFPSAKLWTALTFIVSVTASSLDKRGSSVIIGYRTVSAAQAQGYKNAGNTLAWSESRSSDQLGEGVYISPRIADWPGASTNWDCAILADSNAWNLVNKAWVPASDGCTPLWWKIGDPNRPAYLKALGGSSFTPSNTALLSRIDGFELLQLLIPPQLLGAKGGLKISVQCAAKTDTEGIAAISIYGDVDWSSWLNVKGTVQII
ncbi:Uncharacterized protein BP5553_07895 [Venustampulla echinocandica]|uniref:Uncharacterized protein n=1 Tax=Venustampulla echinocandica TaxID=2656787 RepID=A0A370THU3_9HELO|nr:Uncharacterized protein BP5553_07895 [Venustampulla echinocandica]RDL34767.1 Uncharacterized protein BP5553_07895 [Venustampulla echinocandica]